MLDEGCKRWLKRDLRTFFNLEQAFRNKDSSLLFSQFQIFVEDSHEILKN